MFPSLPSDSFFKTIFFGALVVITILIKYGIDSHQKLIDDINTHNAKMIGIKYAINLTNLEIAGLNKKIKLLKTDSLKKQDTALNTKLDNNRKSLAQNILKLKKLRDERYQKNIEIRIAIASKERYESYSPVLYTVFAIILLLGLIPWVMKEVEKNNFDRDKMQKVEKAVPCQSCGMILKNDFKPFIELELCSNCYDGKTYKEPQLTFKEMQDRVQARMTNQGIDEKSTKKHLAKLAALNRWNKTLKW